MVKSILVASTIALGTAGVVFGIYTIATRPTPSSGEQVQVASETSNYSATPLAPVSKPEEKVATRVLSGAYRCWSFNAGGRGASCTSSQFVFKADGTYSFSSERGTYQIQGNTVKLSGSKTRGPGTLTENDLRLTFHYTYNGLEYTVTYLKR